MPGKSYPYEQPFKQHSLLVPPCSAFQRRQLFLVLPNLVESLQKPRASIEQGDFPLHIWDMHQQRMLVYTRLHLGEGQQQGLVEDLGCFGIYLNVRLGRHGLLQHSAQVFDSCHKLSMLFVALQQCRPRVATSQHCAATPLPLRHHSLHASLCIGVRRAPNRPLGHALCH
jgi:hypothetical protein